MDGETAAETVTNLEIISSKELVGVASGRLTCSLAVAKVSKLLYALMSRRRGWRWGCDDRDEL